MRACHIRGLNKIKEEVLRSGQDIPLTLSGQDAGQVKPLWTEWLTAVSLGLGCLGERELL